PAAMIQSLFLVLAVVAWRFSGRGPGSFLRWSLAATGAAYAVAGVLVALGEREYARLRLLYPYESIEARLPLVKTFAPPPIWAASLAGLDRLDGRLGARGWYRAEQLRQLHEDRLGLFINNPGFGVSRMMLPIARGLTLPTEPVAGQPGPPFPTPWSPGELS